MKIQIKTVILSILLATTITTLKAQTSSPLSQFGIGDLNTPAFGASKGIGAIGIAYRTKKHLNIANPASISALDSMTVIYELGISGAMTQIKNQTGSSQNHNANIDYMAMGFRVNRFYYTSFGLMPTSKVNYTLKNSYSLDYTGNIDNYYHGSGGVNSVYWSNAFKIIENLSVGVEAKLLFGSIRNIKTTVFTEDPATTNNLKVEEKKYISGFKYNLGVQYKINLKKENNITLGAIFDNSTGINATVDSLAGTITKEMPSKNPETYYKEFYPSELNPYSFYTSTNKTKIKLPTSYGGGFSFCKPNLLTVGAEFRIEKWSSIDEPEYKIRFKDNIALRAGIEYIPDHNNINSYFKRVTYRIGGHHTSSHLIVNNSQIKDYGISFGVGLPLRNTKTSFNITCEYGKRGSLSENLFEESYGIISLNLSLSDRWFMKRKFN